MRFVVTVRLLWPSDDTVAHSEGGKASRTSGWSILCMIFEISSIKASGSSTNAWASASGLSSTNGNEHFSSIFLDESRFAFLHSVQDCHSFVAHVPFPFFNCPLG